MLERVSRWSRSHLILLLVLSSSLTLSSLARPAGASQAVSQKLWIRNAWTGVAVPGAGAKMLGTAKSLLAETKADPSGRLSLGPAATAESIEISAPGYKTMTIPASPAKASGGPTAVWLLPDARPEEMRPETIEARREPNTTFLHGHVVSVESGRPVAGATVRLDGAVRATTNRDGYFQLDVKGTRVVSPSDVPEMADLVVSAPGFTRVRLAHVALIEGDFHFVVDLRQGSGETVREMSHKLFPPGFRPPVATEPEEAGPAAAAPLAEAPGTAQDRLARASAAGPAGVNLKATAGGLQVYNPPDQIQVTGYGWFPLEVYVANGLCNEWIASWSLDSLFAGAVAYRTYGSWYQINHGAICATTSCQVFTNTYNSRCDTAAQGTTGILLQKAGAIAFSEFSAENNSYRCSSYSCVNTDLSCGDGRAGSPAAGWSCLSDSHSFSAGPGHCCFGHGHGMCQWGTQAWSSSKLWNWMTDHYYNDFGAGTGNRTMYMTSPFDIVSAGASSTSVARGATFTISETLRSYTDWNQPQILLGASLIGPGTISDPAHDAKVTVLARTSFSVQSRDTAVSRLFTVPSTAATGTYDLLVALWLDTNGNGVIDSNDKALRTLRYTGLIGVH